MADTPTDGEWWKSAPPANAPPAASDEKWWEAAPAANRGPTPAELTDDPISRAVREGFGEPALQAVTGLGSMAAGGAAGLVTGGERFAEALGRGDTPGEAFELGMYQAGDTAKKIQEAGTYQPKSETGKEVSSVIQAPFERLGEFASYLDRHVTSSVLEFLKGEGVDDATARRVAATAGAAANAGTQELAPVAAGKALGKGISAARDLTRKPAPRLEPTISEPQAAQPAAQPQQQPAAAASTPPPQTAPEAAQAAQAGTAGAPAPAAGAAPTASAAGAAAQTARPPVTPISQAEARARAYATRIGLRWDDLPEPLRRTLTATAQDPAALDRLNPAAVRRQSSGRAPSKAVIRPPPATPENDPSIVPGLKPGYTPPPKPTGKGAKSAPQPTASGVMSEQMWEPPVTASGHQIDVQPGAAHTVEQAENFELPEDVQASRRAILKRTGIRYVRDSAVKGNGLHAGTDLQLGKSDEPVGQMSRQQFQSEKRGLRAFGQKIVQRLGGSRGVDETALNNRGQTQAKAFDTFRDYFKAEKKRLYKLANQKAGGAPISPKLQKVEDLLDDETFRNELRLQNQGHIIDSVRSELEKARRDNPNGFNQRTIETFRQFLNRGWKPDTAYAIGKLKGALDEEVFEVLKDSSLYERARAIVKAEHDILNDPKSISKLFDVHPLRPYERSTATVKIPDAIMRLDPESFRNLVSVLEQMPEMAARTPKWAAKLKAASDKALAEIRGHFVNRMVRAGTPKASEGNWSSIKVDEMLDANREKMAIAFGKDAQSIQDIRDLVSAGRILRADPSYPGAGPQMSNLLQKGALSQALPAAASTVGTLVGAKMGGPLGAAAGGYFAYRGGAKLAAARAASASKKLWKSRIQDLGEAPPESPPGAPAAAAQAPPRKPPSKRVAAPGSPGAAVPGAAGETPKEWQHGAESQRPTPAPQLTLDQALDLGERRGFGAQVEQLRGMLQRGEVKPEHAHEQLLEAMGFNPPREPAAPKKPWVPQPTPADWTPRAARKPKSANMSGIVDPGLARSMGMEGPSNPDEVPFAVAQERPPPKDLLALSQADLRYAMQNRYPLGSEPPIREEEEKPPRSRKPRVPFSGPIPTWPKKEVKYAMENRTPYGGAPPTSGTAAPPAQSPPNLTQMTPIPPRQTTPGPWVASAVPPRPTSTAMTPVPRREMTPGTPTPIPPRPTSPVASTEVPPRQMTPGGWTQIPPRPTSPTMSDIPPSRTPQGSAPEPVISTLMADLARTPPGRRPPPYGVTPQGAPPSPRPPVAAPPPPRRAAPPVPPRLPPRATPPVASRLPAPATFPQEAPPPFGAATPPGQPSLPAPADLHVLPPPPPQPTIGDLMRQQGPPRRQQAAPQSREERMRETLRIQEERRRATVRDHLLGIARSNGGRISRSNLEALKRQFDIPERVQAVADELQAQGRIRIQ